MQTGALTVDIKPSRGKIAVVDQSEIRHNNSASTCYLIIMELLYANIRRIISVTEFYNPMPLIIREYRLWSCPSAVTAVIEQKPGIAVLLLFKYLKSYLLKSVEVSYLFLILKDKCRRIRKRPHTVCADYRQTIQR